MRQITIDSSSEDFSLRVGRCIAKELQQGDIIALWGELGAGKTLLTRGIARGLHIPPQIPITSPTFTLINEYEGRLHLYHVDLYRLGDPEELETLPWREAFYGVGVAVIEWPERLGSFLPVERLDIRIHITGEESRSVSLTPHGEKYTRRFDKLQSEKGKILTSCECDTLRK
jgi:tRNA threonylcarbamoyladenosine biosynthesis protein TsaE